MNGRVEYILKLRHNFAKQKGTLLLEKILTHAWIYFYIEFNVTNIILIWWELRLNEIWRILQILEIISMV